MGFHAVATRRAACRAFFGVFFDAGFTQVHRWRHGVSIGEATGLFRAIQEIFSVSASMRQHGCEALFCECLRGGCATFAASAHGEKIRKSGLAWHGGGIAGMEWRGEIGREDAPNSTLTKPSKLTILTV